VRRKHDEALFNSHGGDAAFKELQKVIEAAYTSGYMEGDANIQPYLQKARDLGAADRMAGNRKANRDVPGSWFEVASARLTEAYDEGYDAVDAGVGSETG
jgi:hypothetical protein